MSASQPTRSPLARLVLFMVCLSIAGSAVAAVHYYAIDLPARTAVQAPLNCWCEISNLDGCYHGCIFRTDRDYCRTQCQLLCDKCNADCGQGHCN